MDLCPSKRKHMIPQTVIERPSDQLLDVNCRKKTIEKLCVRVIKKILGRLYLTLCEYHCIITCMSFRFVCFFFVYSIFYCY